MALQRKEKQPREVYDYDVTYMTKHLPMGDTIDTAEASVVCTTDPTDTALVLGVVAPVARYVKVWLGGGTDGQTYKVSVLAVSAGGRTLETDFLVKIKEG